MSGFLKALASFRRGELSREQLLSEIERRLAGGEDSIALLAEVHGEHAKGHLPDDVHRELAHTLRRGLAASAKVPVAGSSAAAADDTDATVDEQGTDVPRALANRSNLAISVGTVLKGRFRLIEPIGEGGMSTVYKAIDLRKVEARAGNTHVAVKLLTVPPSNLTHSLQMLQAEAHKLQRLPHPNIVRVIDCDRDGRTVFMTMELLTGESLKRKMIARDFKAMPPAEATRIIEAIASGLTFAHRNGIVHGDLKPGNVFITDQDEIKIIDFGVARLMTRHPRATSVGDERPKLSALTPPYASPEMLENGEPDPRDDIYGLACIAHELLTGRHPFDRKVATEARDSGLKLRHRGLLPAAQFKAIVHGLEFDREKRAPTVGRFLEEFRAGSLLRAGKLAAIAGALAVVALAATYFVRHGGIHWSAPRPTAAVVAPTPGEVFRDCPTCPRMTWLAPGRFNQGAAGDAADDAPFERPRHPVAIGYPFSIGIYEVTVGEFREFAEATAYKSTGCQAYDGSWHAHPELNWDNAGYSQTATHPVTCVSWRDAQDYAAWLSKRTGQKYRLPSESEWEYAARAGSDSVHPWTAGASACASANVADQTAAQHYPGWNAFPCTDGYVYTAPVGSFRPNAFGMYDMLGNVSEWVQDCWHPDYLGAPADGSAWVSGDCGERDLRGGSWFTAPAVVSLSARNRFEDNYRSNSVGFRLVREIKR